MPEPVNPLLRTTLADVLRQSDFSDPAAEAYFRLVRSAGTYSQLGFGREGPAKLAAPMGQLNADPSISTDDAYKYVMQHKDDDPGFMARANEWMRQTGIKQTPKPFDPDAFNREILLNMWLRQHDGDKHSWWSW